MINSVSDFGYSFASLQFQNKRQNPVENTTKKNNYERGMNVVADRITVNQHGLKKKHADMTHLTETSTLLKIIELFLGEIEKALSMVADTEENRAGIVVSLMRSIDKTKYKGKRLFDGSYANRVRYRGDCLQVCADSVIRKLNTFNGTIPVWIHQFPTKASTTGFRKLTKKIIAAGMIMKVRENDRKAAIETQPGQSPEQVVAALNAACADNNVEVSFSLNADAVVTATHNKWGADSQFSLYDSVGGILNKPDGGWLTVNNGRHVRGTIGRQKTHGRNAVLKSDAGSYYDGIALCVNQLPEGRDSMGGYSPGHLSVKVNPLVVYPGGVNEYRFYPEDIQKFIVKSKTSLIDNTMPFDQFKHALRQKTDRVSVFAHALRSRLNASKKTMGEMIDNNRLALNCLDNLKHKFIDVLTVSNRMTAGSLIAHHLSL